MVTSTIWLGVSANVPSWANSIAAFGPLTPSGSAVPLAVAVKEKEAVGRARAEPIVQRLNTFAGPGEQRGIVVTVAPSRRRGDRERAERQEHPR